jgi:hypothetical protein
LEVREQSLISRTGLNRFYDLNGGRTEYVITIACMIGKSRMKGEKVVTNLVPYGPEKPRSGMVRSAGTRQVTALSRQEFAPRVEIEKPAPVHYIPSAIPTGIISVKQF